MSDNHQPALAKRDSTNYMVWITHMEDHLVGKDLLEAVAPGFLSGTPSPEDLRKDRKAFSLLKKYVSDSLIHFMTSSMTAADAWLILAVLNLSNSYSRIRGLIKAGVRLNLQRGEGINNYIRRAKSLQLSLRMANEPISEMIMVTAILGGLPREYNTIVTILEAEDATLTISSVQAKLCAMEQSIRDNRTTPPDATAMLAGRSTVVCDYCKKFHHTADQCYQKFPELRPGFSSTAIPPAPTVMHARIADEELEELATLLRAKANFDHITGMSTRVEDGHANRVTMANPDPGDRSIGGYVDGEMHYW
jgi:hypothetical protein